MTEEVGSGFIVDVNFEDFQKANREMSKIILKLVWTNLDALFFGPQKIRDITFPSFRLRIYRFRGFGWLTFPVFPFAMIHESLHFVIGYFTKNHHLVTLIPPILDLFSLPLVLVWGIFFHPNRFLFIGLMLWIEWVWILHLISNISGDFSPYLHKKRESPHNSEP